jgi:hypothetical protein
MDATRMNQINDVQPNDVAIIFRPLLEEGKEWDGEYTVMLTGFSPVSMNKEDFNILVNVAAVIASVVSLIEHNEQVRNIVLAHYAQFSANNNNYLSSTTENFKDDFVLDANTETIGKMQ